MSRQLCDLFLDRKENVPHTMLVKISKISASLRNFRLLPFPDWVEWCWIFSFSYIRKNINFDIPIVLSIDFYFAYPIFTLSILFFRDREGRQRKRTNLVSSLGFFISLFCHHDEILDIFNSSIVWCSYFSGFIEDRLKRKIKNRYTKITLKFLH